jgi:hypothetical protein
LCFHSDALFGLDTLLRFSFDFFLIGLVLDRFICDRRRYLWLSRLRGRLGRTLILMRLDPMLWFINMECAKRKCIRLLDLFIFGSISFRFYIGMRLGCSFMQLGFLRP